MSVEPGRARAVRGAHRGVVTKLINEAEELLHITKPLQPSQRGQLNVINQLLDGKLNTLSDMDRDILSLCKLYAIDSEIEESEAVVAKIYNCKQQIEEAMSVNPRTELSASVSSASAGPLVTPPKPRLPKLVLPKFKGDVKDWTAFWDSFKSTVHENEDIPKVDKFNYLNSLLEGAAFRTIQGLPLTASNYDSAITMLGERFGNTQQIISVHMEGLLKIPNCAGDRSTSLRAVFDKIMVHVRGLETLGVRSAQYGSLLIPVIMTKFPSDIRLRIARETGREAWKIDDLLRIVKQEVEAREASEGAAVNPAKVPAQPIHNPPINSTASSLVTSNRKIQCAYCGGEHFSASCSKITTVKDRRDILLKSGRCFNCLKTRHKSRDCDSPRNCRYCNRRHHQSICDQSPAFQKDSNESKEPEKTSTTTSASKKATKGTQVILLQTARAVAINGAEQVSIRILLDSGSQLSYVTKDLQERLRLKPIRREKLHLNTFGNSAFDAHSCDVVQFKIQKPNSNETLNITACNLLYTPYSNQSEHLDGLELADSNYQDQHHPIDVLIGSDHYWNIVTGDTVIGNHGPVAISSKLGWLVSGPLDHYSDATFTQSHVIINGDSHDSSSGDENDVLVSMLHQFWHTESIGVLEDNRDDATPTFLNQMRLKQDRYEVPLPWKEDHPEIPDHYVMCINRLRYLQRKLLKTPELLQEYDAIIQDQLKQGIIEPVTKASGNVPKDGAMENGMVHYLPHHCVIRQDKQTTKLRIVYDGSAKTTTDNVSLNDCLEIGPNLIPKLFDVLISFRWHLVAVTADIEKVFLMIEIIPSDQHMLRFLWLQNPHDVESDLLELRFTRLVFGLRPSPAILGSVISHHLDKYHSKYPEIIPSIKNSFYVDDLISGGNSVEEAFNTYTLTKQAMLEGGFNLRKWNLNSPELLSKIASSSGQPVSGLVTDNETNGGEGVSSHFIVRGNNRAGEQCKLLGIMWNSCSDEFIFCFSELIDLVSNLPNSRRSLLKVTASIFDPLGLLSPFIIKLKLLFQTLCRRKVGWDEPLTDKSLKQWNELSSEFAVLNQLRMPQCYFDDDVVPDLIEYHGFSDASEHAYAAVLYLRTVSKNGRMVTRLVASKPGLLLQQNSQFLDLNY